MANIHNALSLQGFGTEVRNLNHIRFIYTLFL